MKNICFHHQQVGTCADIHVMLHHSMSDPVSGERSIEKFSDCPQAIYLSLAGELDSQVSGAGIVGYQDCTIHVVFFTTIRKREVAKPPGLSNWYTLLLYNCITSMCYLSAGHPLS
jgi:hypothetical protein